MRPIVIPSLLIAIFACAQDVYLRLTDYGGGKINLVVERFTAAARGESSRRVSVIEDIIKRDLEYSLYFDIFEDTSLVPTGSTQGVILKGVATGEEIDIRLEDFETREKISERIYAIDEGLRKTAHTVADDVIKILTGETGISSTKIVFSYKTANGKEIARIDYDGYNFTRITETGNINLFPSYAPDGGRILFSTYASDRLNIYLYDFAKKQIESVSSFTGLNFAPCWAPDGSKICMSLSKDGNAELYLLDLNTRKMTRLTRNSAIDTSPTF